TNPRASRNFRGSEEADVAAVGSARAGAFAAGQAILGDLRAGDVAVALAIAGGGTEKAVAARASAPAQRAHHTVLAPEVGQQEAAAHVAVGVGGQVGLVGKQREKRLALGRGHARAVLVGGAGRVDWKVVAQRQPERAQHAASHRLAEHVLAAHALVGPYD